MTPPAALVEKILERLQRGPIGWYHLEMAMLAHRPDGVSLRDVCLALAAAGLIVKTADGKWALPAAAASAGSLDAAKELPPGDPDGDPDGDPNGDPVGDPSHG